MEAHKRSAPYHQSNTSEHTLCMALMSLSPHAGWLGIGVITLLFAWHTYGMRGLGVWLGRCRGLCSAILPVCSTLANTRQAHTQAVLQME